MKNGPDDFLWHSSIVARWRWKLCVSLAWSIWQPWWTSTQCRSMPYFRQWCWSVGKVSFRRAVLSTLKSTIQHAYLWYSWSGYNTYTTLKNLSVLLSNIMALGHIKKLPEDYIIFFSLAQLIAFNMFVLFDCMCIHFTDHKIHD